MIVVYVLALVFLTTFRAITGWRAAQWEAYFLNLTVEADDALKESKSAGGNDLAQGRAQMKLARLADKQDSAESSYKWWNGWKERFGSTLNGLWEYRNTSAGYAFAKVDALIALAVVSYLGLSVDGAFKLIMAYMGH